MRPIKFRGKRKDNGEWVYGSLIVNPPYDLNDGTHKPSRLYNFIQEQKIKWNNQERCWRFEVYEVDPETVGEFTGLCDKNGKEIYEGDIVKAPAMEENAIGEIIWEMNCFVIKGKMGTTGLTNYGGRFSPEVIGSIHDPEPKENTE